MPQPPDLEDPVQRAAYRQELRGVARGLRTSALGLAVIGAGIAFAAPFLGLPRWVPMLVIGPAVMLIVTGVAVRTRYHRNRMRGDL
ncbi:hypothetical protein [Sphingomonas sp.]|uniref:hypothetical protein n=1 Tax=Sphingomonas sp. TaxID=28214 RepID=UPI001EBB0C3E|nr:hypothetical protein [Sphingomonas sp.]MBX3595659.1 hypothetical protein [Sphingomonas sp.]